MHFLQLMGDLFDVLKISKEVDISSNQNVLSIVFEEKFNTIISARHDYQFEFIDASTGWRALCLSGIYDFSQSGLLYSVIKPLRDGLISVLVVSSFDRDYIFFQEENVESAIGCLLKNNFKILDENGESINE